MTARARRTDPNTSHEAALRAAQKLKSTQIAVLVIFRITDRPLLDEELIKEYSARRRALGLPVQSQSGIRSRRSELAKMDPPRVIAGERKKMSIGGTGLTWVAAPRETP